MDFNDWYCEPERGAEIQRALDIARRIARGENEDDILFIFAEAVMRRAWNAACAECLAAPTSENPTEHRLH